MCLPTRVVKSLYKDAVERDSLVKQNMVLDSIIYRMGKIVVTHEQSVSSLRKQVELGTQVIDAYKAKESLYKSEVQSLRVDVRKQKRKGFVVTIGVGIAAAVTSKILWK